MSDGIEVQDEEFYHLTIDGDESLFTTRESAVERIVDRIDDIDIDNSVVELARVDTDTDDGDEDGWTISPVPWQKIALQVMQG